MRTLLIVLVVIAVAVFAYLQFSKKENPKPKPPKQQPVAVSKYSNAFISSVDKTLTDYYELSEAFVNWNNDAIIKEATSLQNNLNQVQFKEIEKDTVIHQTAISYVQSFGDDLNTIITEADIEKKRQAFHSFSQNYYDLLRTIRYDGSPVYFQECPMAFNDTESGHWLSKTSDIRNPYLGLHHPKYKGGMLECGETKDSLRFN